MEYRVSYRNVSMSPETLNVLLDEKQKRLMINTIATLSRLIGLDPKKQSLIIEIRDQNALNLDD